MASRFPGFPKQGMKFFSDLAKNNNREWFQERKEVFETTVREPMEQLVDAINGHLVKFAPMYVTEPRKAIYRIYRDTRFSKDKTPYKTNIAASFSRSAAEKHVYPGYYLGVSPKEIEVAGGVYMPGPEQLMAIRTHLLEHHEAFRKLVNNARLKKLMGGLWGDQMTRPPKGFPAEHPAIDLIRYKMWIFYDTRLDPALATTPKLLGEVVKRFEAMAEFVEFLCGPLKNVKPADPLLRSERN